MPDSQPDYELSRPTCGDILDEARLGAPTKFTRGAGYVWRMNALLKVQLEQAERGIWQAVHALEDHADLAGVLAARRHAPGAIALLDQTKAARQHIADLYRLLTAVNELRKGPIGNWP